MPASLSHRSHFSRFAVATTSSFEPAPSIGLYPSARVRDAQTAGSASADPAFCSRGGVFSPASDPPPFSDEINPTFGRNPNEPQDLT